MTPDFRLRVKNDFLELFLHGLHIVVECLTSLPRVGTHQSARLEYGMTSLPIVVLKMPGIPEVLLGLKSEMKSFKLWERKSSPENEVDFCDDQQFAPTIGREGALRTY